VHADALRVSALLLVQFELLDFSVVSQSGQDFAQFVDVVFGLREWFRDGVDEVVELVL